MTRLQKKPENWLELEDCKDLYHRYRAVADKLELPTIPEWETRYDGVLESLLYSVKLAYGNEYLKPTLLDVASNYFNKLVRGQCFLNGNKRMGVFFTHVYLIRNGVDITLESDEMFRLAALVVEGSEIGVPAEKTLEYCKEAFGKFTKEIETPA